MINKTVTEMINQLNHNDVNSLIRRPPGLTDMEWNILVIESIKSLSVNKTSFFYELALFCMNNVYNKKYESILKSLGVTKYDVSLFKTSFNFEHFSYRVFRHFCPESFRNAMNHSGLPFATLDEDKEGFRWQSKQEFKLMSKNHILNCVSDSNIGDKIIIIAKGKEDIEKIDIYNDTSMMFINYYNKNMSKSFGDMMYILKKFINANKKKEKH